MNDSPLNKAAKRLRFSELRRDGSLNRIATLRAKLERAEKEMNNERQTLAFLDSQVEANYKTLIQIRDGHGIFKRLSIVTLI
jgi:flagellar motility protein MotE (MotC chaperone)